MINACRALCVEEFTDLFGDHFVVLNSSCISKARSVHDSEVVRYFESFHVR